MALSNCTGKKVVWFEFIQDTGSCVYWKIKKIKTLELWFIQMELLEDS